MPKNKDALVRYRIINRSLKDFKYVSIGYLMDACYNALGHEISYRTIEKDIHDMKYDPGLGYFAPIKYDRYEEGYYYDDEDYSIDKFDLDYDDLKALTFASATLEQYKSFGIFSTFTGAVQKIINTMKIHRELRKYAEKQVVGFENAPLVKGEEHISPLLDAILLKKVLRIEHKRFDLEEMHVHIVHPYYLKEYRNRWYLLGYQSENKRIQTYGLERILSIEPARNELFTEVPFDPEEYYKYAIGVIVYDEPPTEITLKFTLKQGMYILTQPVHHSQQVIEKTGRHVIVSLVLVPAYEFISMVSGWGAEVEVLAPLWLREKVQDEVRKTLNLYKRK